jgi:hypothetical protein
MAASSPDGPDRMDDPLGRQIVTLGYFRRAGFASVKLSAFLQEARAGGTVYGSVHTASSKQAFVGGVHNGIDTLKRNIALDDFYAILQMGIIH